MSRLIEEMLRALCSRKHYEALQIRLTKVHFAADVCHMFIIIYATFSIAVIYQITKGKTPGSIMCNILFALRKSNPTPMKLFTVSY